MTVEPVRAAVVGAGLMGRWHARELQRAGGELVGIADADPARAPLGVDELLAAAPGVVHVCTPLPSHAELVERCLEAGAHVLCEKPLAEDAATTQRLLAAAAARDRHLCPTHQYLFQPGFARIARAVPRLAPILHLDIVACSAGGEGRDADEVVAEILPHPLAVFERLVPGGVATLEWSVARPRPGELRATAAVEGMDVGVLVSLGGRPTANELRVLGAGGTARADFFHGYAVIEGAGVSRARKVIHPLALAAATAGAATANLSRRAARAQPAYPGLRELIAALYAATRSEGPPPISPEETLAVALARDALTGT
jgi:predicted dehydrogenase